MSKHVGSLYSYTAGVYSGVLMPERVMWKLCRLQSAHLDAVKNLLLDNKNELFASDWTLHYPDGKQTIVRYTNPNKSEVENRIKMAMVSSKPEHCPVVYYAENMGTAKALADADYAGMTEENA